MERQCSHPSQEDIKRPHQNGDTHTLLDSDDELENGLLDIKVLLNENGFKEDEWWVLQCVCVCVCVCMHACVHACVRVCV